MRFEGRVYFDFVNPAVWWFYRFLTVASKAGADLRGVCAAPTPAASQG